MGNSICKKHQIMYYNHVRYIKNDITIPFVICMFNYTEFDRDIFYLKLFLSPPSNKDKEFYDVGW